jgi:serine/threonine-protein phosphatase 5
MSESSQSTPPLSSTPPSSAIPSPALSTLSLTDPKEVTEDDRQEAAKLKADANKAFVCKLSRPNFIDRSLIPTIPCSKAHEFLRAAKLYTEAIAHNPGDATLFCNRAYTRIKLEEHGYALHDAGELWHTPHLVVVPFREAKLLHRSARNRT